MSEAPRDGDHTNEDPEEVRLKAFALLNRIGKDADDDASNWPEKPSRQSYSSYQKNVGTKQEMDELRRRPAHTARNDYYEEWGMAGLMVSCIADACKKSAEYAASSTGYESLVQGSTKDADGEFEKVGILNTYRSTGQTSGEM